MADLTLETLIKCTGPGGVSAHGGNGCGLRLVTIAQAPIWLSAELWLVEVGEGAERIEEAGKMVVSRARVTERIETWTETTARLLGADCAEHVLPVFERLRPDDDRPRRAIEAARAYARGQATRGELVGAWSAARDAAWSAARDAAWSAARSAARDAAWSAARSAADAGDAAGTAERRWQSERLAYLRGEAS